MTPRGGGPRRPSARALVPVVVAGTVAALAGAMWATAPDSDTRTAAVSLGIAALSFLGAYLGVRWSAESAEKLAREADEARFVAAIEVLRSNSLRYQATVEQLRAATDPRVQRSLADTAEDERMQLTAATVQAQTAGALLHHGSDTEMARMRRLVARAASGEAD